MGRLRILGEYLRTALGRGFADREELLAWQDCKVREHLAYVRERSPFYRALYDGLDGADWRSFPIIGKREMMAEFSTLNTVGIGREEAFDAALRAESSRDFAPRVRGITVGLSSGTSGNRGLFLVSDAERDRWAGHVLAKLLPHPIWREQRIAFFLRANSNLYESVGSKRIAFSYYDLTRPFDELVTRVEEDRPDMIVAPPAVLSLLAREQEAGRTSLRPARVVSVADVLEDGERNRIAAAFGVTVHQAYQATEGLIGLTCDLGTMHLNEDILAVQDRPLGNRRFSPIITDFRRRTQPIIRYALDDVLVECARPCPCGSPLRSIERIEGRCDQAIIPGGDLGKAIFPDFLRRAIITAAPEVQEYRFTYKGPTAEIALSFPLSADGIAQVSSEKAITEGIDAVFRSRGVSVPVLSFVPLDAQDLAVKRRRIVNLS